MQGPVGGGGSFWTAPPHCFAWLLTLVLTYASFCFPEVVRNGAAGAQNPLPQTTGSLSWQSLWLLSSHQAGPRPFEASLDSLQGRLLKGALVPHVLRCITEMERWLCDVSQGQGPPAPPPPPGRTGGIQSHVPSGPRGAIYRGL